MNSDGNSARIREDFHNESSSDAADHVSDNQYIAGSPEHSNAVHTILEGWFSSENEKLVALRLLEATPSKESIKALSHALSTCRAPLCGTTVEVSEEQERMPRGGMVAAYAARALARMDSYGSRDLVLESLRDSTHHAYLRETAFWGLEAAGGPGVFDAIRIAVEDPDFVIRRRAVILASRKFTGDVSTTKEHPLVVKALIESLFQIPISREEPAEREVFFLLRNLIPKLLVESTVEYLYEKLFQVKELDELCLVLDLLGGARCQQATTMLCGLLQQRNHHPVIYRSIARGLKTKVNDEVRRVAEEIVGESSVIATVLSAISRERKESLEARRATALEVLGS